MAGRICCFLERGPDWGVRMGHVSQLKQWRRILEASQRCLSAMGCGAKTAGPVWCCSEDGSRGEKPPEGSLFHGGAALSRPTGPAAGRAALGPGQLWRCRRTPLGRAMRLAGDAGGRRQDTCRGDGQAPVRRHAAVISFVPAERGLRFRCGGSSRRADGDGKLQPNCWSRSGARNVRVAGTEKEAPGAGTAGATLAGTVGLPVLTVSKPRLFVCGPTTRPR
jgi:hypothetical protein